MSATQSIYRKVQLLFITLVMFIALFSVTAVSAAATEVSAADFVNNVYNISAAGTYNLAADVTGAINVNTTGAVTIAGYSASTQYGALSITCTVAGANLTIQDLFISAGHPASQYYDSNNGNYCYNILNFTGTGNTLTIDGSNVLEAIANGAVIHVASNAALTIEGTGTLYLYKTGAWTAIGGNGSEANGEITINGGNIFAKGSRMGAVVGSGSYCSAVPGDITINGGVLNLIANARGAAIGVGAGDAGGSGTFPASTGNVYITGGTVNINVDFTGAAIGNAGTNSAPDQGDINGNLIITGGSLRTFIDENAYPFWSLGDSGVNDIGITAAKTNGNEDVYLCVIPGDSESNEVYVDWEPFYEGGLHEYKYVNEELEKTDQVDITDTTQNWITGSDTNLYIYLTGTSHDLMVNGEYYFCSWNGDGTFTLY